MPSSRLTASATRPWIALISSSVSVRSSAWKVKRQATLLQTQILHALEIYTFLGIQYFVILTLLTWLARYLERKFPQYR